MKYRIVNSPWPEREGLTCRIVPRPPRPEGDMYPWPGKGRGEAVIIIDGDPLVDADERGWSCVISYKSLVPAG